MSLSMYQASVPVFTRMLTNLSVILTKAEAHATARKIEPEVLLGMRLYPDMLSLVQQVRLSSDFAKGAAARLAGREIPSYPDEEASFEELQQRIRKTLEFIKGVKATEIDSSEQREIKLTIAGQLLTLAGQDYLLFFALPNFYFHVTTAYAILRHGGLEIGKRDFIGPR
jgi:hypothetical protein